MPTFHDLNAQLKTMGALISALAEPEFKHLRTRLVDALDDTESVKLHLYDMPEHVLFCHSMNYLLILQCVNCLRENDLLDRIKNE